MIFLLDNTGTVRCPTSAALWSGLPPRLSSVTLAPPCVNSHLTTSTWPKLAE